MSWFFIIFFTLYAAINYYLFIRGWQAISQLQFLKPFYTVAFIIAAASYIVARSLNSKIPLLYDIILGIGSIWFAYILYLFLAIVLLDFLRLLNWQFDIFPAIIKNNYEAAKQITLLIVFLLASVLILAGYLNTRNIVINKISITLPKKSSQLDELNIAFIADTHLSPLNQGSLLKDIVDKINSLEPDIVLIAGDIVDDDTGILRARNIGKEFLQVKSKYGVYACTGNHEFINNVDSTVNYMKDFNINVLRDSAVLIEGSFYVLGRDDTSKINFTGMHRKTLAQIMEDVDKSYPVILVEHTPFNLAEAMKNGIDLQLSGHTHHGQLAPANFITSIVYELSWGYLRKGNTQYYVTSGAGTWGPPVRLGSDSEIVNIKVKFE